MAPLVDCAFLRGLHGVRERADAPFFYGHASRFFEARPSVLRGARSVKPPFLQRTHLHVMPRVFCSWCWIVLTINCFMLFFPFSSWLFDAKCSPLHDRARLVVTPDLRLDVSITALAGTGCNQSCGYFYSGLNILVFS
jgi:hypothetical protein